MDQQIEIGFFSLYVRLAAAVVVRIGFCLHLTLMLIDLIIKSIVESA
jgi:hypothetical protein